MLHKHVTAIVKVRQTWMLAIDPAVDVLAKDEQRGRRTMVGTLTSVLHNASAEFAERHTGNAIVMPLRLHVCHEGGHCLGEFAQQVRMRSSNAPLIRMRVEVEACP